MHGSDIKPGERVKDVHFTEDTIAVDLMDGRTIVVPLAWYPKLLEATSAQRANWEVSGAGYGIHGPDIDEHPPTLACQNRRVIHVNEESIRDTIQRYSLLVRVGSRTDGRSYAVAWYQEVPGCMAEAADEAGAVEELGAIIVPFLQALLADGSALPTPNPSVFTQTQQIRQLVLGDVHRLLRAKRLQDSDASTSGVENRFSEAMDGKLVKV
ncbi:MAG TPA: DUF2442 domain-containing protein [Gemmatimonadales bacterium]|jgi:predicted RNase H-like HicB family nuclease